MVDPVSLPQITSGLKNKTVMVRVDFNIKLEGREVSQFGLFRVRAVVPLLKKLLTKGARVVVMSHRGAPTGPDAALSLRPFVKVLQDIVGVSCGFSNVDAFVKNNTHGAGHPTSLLLLENLRFHPQEMNNDSAWARACARSADVYINEAFSVSHRAHASVQLIPKFLPSFVGPNFVREIKALDVFMNGGYSSRVLVMGGKKISTKIEYIRLLARRFDTILIGGALVNNFLVARGFDCKKSFFEPEYIDRANELMRSLKKKIVIARDVVWDASGDTIIDIGPHTVKEFVSHIKGADAVVWNGPLGVTGAGVVPSSVRAIGRALASLRKAYTIVGGGETIVSLDQLALLGKMNYVSTAGGAMLYYLAHGDLPALKYIKHNGK